MDNPAVNTRPGNNKRSVGDKGASILGKLIGDQLTEEPGAFAR